MELRYSARGAPLLRGLKAIYYGTVINAVVLAFVLAAAMRLFEVFLPWHEWLPAGWHRALVSGVQGIGLELASGVTPLPEAVATANNLLSLALMLAFVALYSTTGGLRAVIATDVIQLALMLAGTALYAWFALRAAGGLDGLPARLAAIYGPERAAQLTGFAPPPGEAFWPFVTVVALQWLFQMNADGTGYLAQRSMACADDREARVAAVVFSFVQIVVRSLLWLVIGLALLVVYPFDPARPVTEGFVAGRELGFATGIDLLLPAGARGLMLTALLAALASTIDTHLNWGASYWANDLYRALWVERFRRRRASARALVRVARVSGLALLGLALAIMVRLDSIQTAWQVSLLFGAGTGLVLVLRWLWERVNLAAEVAAIVVSIVVAPLLLWLVAADWLRLAAMAAISTLAVVAASLWLPPTEPARLWAFYDRVRPPGFWHEAARGTGADPAAPRRALARGLLAIVAAAVSLFGSLVGIGRALVGGGEPVVNAVLVGAALAAVPLWWRALATR